MAALANFPEDLMIEILSRLPAESLLRFKSVCKSWYALIYDPKFVRKHFSHSRQHNHVLLQRCVLIKCPESKYRRITNIFSIFKNPFSVDLFESLLDIDLPVDNGFGNLKMCGHSHGLFCLSSMGSGIFLWNPTMREFRKLPPSVYGFKQDPFSYISSTNAVGFGYDPKSKDFKVVRVVDFKSPIYRRFSRVEIYDLSKDKWREIESPVCGDTSFTTHFHFQTYHEGTYYWWANAYESSEISEIIKTFNLSKEVFGIISIPEEVKEQHHKARTMGVFNGSIGIISCDHENTLNIWKSNKDESGIFSWSRLSTIDDPGFEIVMPLLFVSCNELLIEVKQGLVILYNIKTQHFKHLPIKGHPFRFEATFFFKSLVSVKGGMKGF